MMLTMTKSVLLSVLTAAAATSSVFAADTRIVGGSQADPGDYPYFVEMGGCGGALVAPDVVLFAAHCESWKDKQISIGAYKTMSLQSGAQERFCDTWVKDPKYGTEGSDINYDFALCKLNEPVNIDESKVKLELNFQANVPSVGEDLVVMGLGALAQGARGPEFVHDVVVPVVSNKACNKANAYNGQITDAMMCAGFPKTGGKDSCQGDSGGPIVKRTRKSDGTYVDTHVGVVSWGEGCALKNKPGVYARTSVRANWIKSTMCGQLKSVASFCDNKPESPPSCSGAETTISVTTDKYGIETKWTLKDPSKKTIMTRQYLIANHKNEHKLCLQANTCYDWTIFDEYSDGMCADNNCGSYSIAVGGKVVKSGNGRFGRSKKERFCTGDGGNNPSPVATPTNPPVQAPVDSPTDAPTQSSTDGNTNFGTGSFDTEPPTASPTFSPTASPTKFDDHCTDDPQFRFRNMANKDCKWVGRGKKQNIRKKCNRKFMKVKVYDWCPETCGEKVGLGMCA